MTELLSKASGMKANGTLDVGELEKFCNNASMFLSPEQVSRMRMIIGMLK